MAKERFNVSTSVRAALWSAPMSASDLAGEIFKQHKEYAGGLAGQLHLQDTSGKKTADIWIEEIGRLFRPEQISGSLLDGRMVVIGLSLLEPELWHQLDEAAVWMPLINEVSKPLSEILTEKGKELYSAYIYTVSKEQILPSYSVKEALSRLPSQEPISAAQLAQEIFKQHKEYAKGRAASVSIVDTAKRLPAEKWLDEIRTLFDLSAIEKIEKSAKPERIESVPFREGPPHSKQASEAPKK